MVSGVGMCCRLCLRTDNLISAFDKRLTNGYFLRMCIYLTAGVEIKMTDKIPKNVCNQCCSLSVQVFEFRQIALANDKALKELINQEHAEPPTNKEDIQALTSKILDNISQARLSDSVPKVYKVPASELKSIDNADLVSTNELKVSVDASLNENNPNVTVPRQILEENISPLIKLDSKEICKYRVSSCVDSDYRVANFKRKHSNIDLVNIFLQNFEDSDSDVPIFKSRKKKPGYRYDDSGSDYDVISDLGGRTKNHSRPKKSRKRILDSDSDKQDSDSNNPDEKLNKQTSSKCSEYDSDETCDSRKDRLRNQRTRTRIFEWDNEDVIEEITRKKSPSRCSDYDTDGTNEIARKDSLRKIKTKPLDYDTPNADQTKKPTEAYSKYCEYCDRYFWGCSQLKAHQRVHFRCHICKKGFESYAILDEHLLTVCYKTVCRKINIPVERVDQNVKLLERYKEAFDIYFQDINDGVYGDPDQLKNPSVKPHLYHTEKHRLEEQQIITDIIKKYANHDNTPITKNKLLQTRRLETDITCGNSNHIVLDDIKTDVSLYNIPVIIVVDRIQSASISFAPKARMKNVVASWSTNNVKNLAKKSNLLQPIHIKQEVPENVTENNPPSSLLEAVFKAPIGTRFDLSSKAKKVSPGTNKQFQPRAGGTKARPNVKPTPIRKPPVVKASQKKKQSPKSNQVTAKRVQKSINMAPKVSNVMKNLPNSVTLVPNKTSAEPKPNLPRVFNISESVTLERNTQGKGESNYNQTSQNNDISYPPRPSTAIRNMLESISDEISIEPNYNRQKPTNHVAPPKSTGEFSILQSSFQCLNNQEIKEELPNDSGYNEINDTISDTSYNNQVDYSEYPVKSENENCEMYNQQPDLNFGYPQMKYEAPQFVQNRPQMPRHRFDVQLNGIIHRPQGQNLNPYQNFRMQNPNLVSSSVYQANQNHVQQQQTRDLVPVSGYNSNFMENVYERPYQDRFNPGFGNVYQQNPYQNPYIPPNYNTQPQFHDMYQESNRDKFVRVKQPWELYRR